MNKILLAMIICAFSVSALACDGSHGKSKTQPSDETTKSKTKE